MSSFKYFQLFYPELIIPTGGPEEYDSDSTSIEQSNSNELDQPEPSFTEYVDFVAEAEVEKIPSSNAKDTEDMGSKISKVSRKSRSQKSGTQSVREEYNSHAVSEQEQGAENELEHNLSCADTEYGVPSLSEHDPEACADNSLPPAGPASEDDTRASSPVSCVNTTDMDRSESQSVDEVMSSVWEFLDSFPDDAELSPEVFDDPCCSKGNLWRDKVEEVEVEIPDQERARGAKEHLPEPFSPNTAFLIADDEVYEPLEHMPPDLLKEDALHRTLSTELLTGTYI